MIVMTEAHVFAGWVVLQPNTHVMVTLLNSPNWKWMVEERNKQTWDVLFQFHSAQFLTLSSTKILWWTYPFLWLFSRTVPRLSYSNLSTMRKSLRGCTWCNKDHVCGLRKKQYFDQNISYISIDITYFSLHILQVGKARLTYMVILSICWLKYYILNDCCSNLILCTAISFMPVWHYLSHIIRKPVYAMCKQQRRRSTCASVQSDQHLCFSLPR